MTMSENATTLRNRSPLRTEDACELVAQVSRLSRAGLPLAEGLRAAAAEAESARLSATLLALAGDVERGIALNVALDGLGDQLPTYLRGMIAAAQQTAQLDSALTTLLEDQQAQQELWQTIRGSIAYPLLLAVMGGLIILASLLILVPHFREIYEDFDIMLPAVTRFLLWCSQRGVWYALATLILAAVLFPIGPVLWGRVGWRRLLYRFPLLGSAIHWSGVATFSRLLSVLLKSNVTLPTALRLAADASADAHIAETSRSVAADVADGHAFSNALSRTRTPQSLVTFVEWGEKTGELPDALRQCADILDAKIRFRAAIFRSIVPGLVIVAVGCALLLLVIGLYAPMLDLIQGLS